MKMILDNRQFALSLFHRKVDSEYSDVVDRGLDLDDLGVRATPSSSWSWEIHDHHIGKVVAVIHLDTSVVEIDEDWFDLMFESSAQPTTRS